MRKNLSRLVPIGLVLLSSGLLLNRWMHGDYAESISGFLIGISLVFIVAGFVRHSRRLS